ncbi:MAG: 3'-5' exonuclease [Candidatus Binatia bacterium]|nr:3'-5' exonuclease [Candidatus Binatia bacterium]
MSTSTRPAEILRYDEGFGRSWSDDASSDDIRFVVLDCETTGLDPRKDRLITIGAVGLHRGEIVLEDAFEAMLKIDHNLSAVTVHGITRDAARDGQDEPDALLAFLDYLRDGVIVGHHIGHDIGTLDVALDRHFGAKLLNRWIDTMDLTLLLERGGAFGEDEPMRSFSLDALCERFEVKPYGRHTAPGDALLTALVFLKLLRVAARNGRGALAALCERAPVVDPEA